jgi:hypothetical protein
METENLVEDFLDDYELDEVIHLLIRHGVCESEDILARLEDYLQELQELLDEE